MIEVLFNDVTLEGMRRVKVVSDSPIDAASLPVITSASASMRTWSDELLGLHYLEATWACRGPVVIRCEGWVCAKLMVLWKLEPGQRVSEAFRDAYPVYLESFHIFPDHAFMRRLPREIDNGFELSGVMFIEAEWVPAGCIVLGNGG